jgi:hypothetical protein
MKTCAYFLSFVSLITAVRVQGVAPSINFDINAQSVGTLVDPTTKQIFGTAFVAGKNHPRLYTCWHVGRIGNPSAPKEYRSAGAAPGTLPFVSEVKPILSAIGYDLETFDILRPVDFPPLEFGDSKSIRPGDTVIYMGYRAGNNTLDAETATVQAVGSVLNEGVITDYLEFVGKGVPGYSGGPVFNRDGKVVALMREAWTMKGLQPGSPEILINRAYSTALLKTFDAEVYAITPEGVKSQRVGP